MRSARLILLAFLPFWLFLAIFKLGGGLHYTLMSPYGEGFFPIWVIGILIGGASLLQLALDVPGGRLLDRLGYVQMLMVSTAAFFLASLCIAAGLTKTTFLLSLGLAVIGWLFYGPGGSAYILSHATHDESGRYFSLRDTFGSIGIVCASIALPFVILLQPAVTGVILSFLFGMSFLLLLLVPPDHPQKAKQPMPHHARRRHPRHLVADMRRLNPASGMLVLLTFTGAVFYGIIWFSVPLVIAHQQADAGFMGVGLAIFDFAVVALGYALGTLADRGNKRTLVFFGLLAFSIFGILVGLDFGWLFLLFGFLATTGEELAEISLWSWMHHLDRDHTADGTISAVITFFEDLGWAVGPVVAGALYILVGPALTISLGALPIFCVWIIYYLFVHKHFTIPYQGALAYIPYRHKRRKHKS